MAGRTILDSAFFRRPFKRSGRRAERDKKRGREKVTVRREGDREQRDGWGQRKDSGRGQRTADWRTDGRRTHPQSAIPYRDVAGWRTDLFACPNRGKLTWQTGKLKDRLGSGRIFAT